MAQADFRSWGYNGHQKRGSRLPLFDPERKSLTTSFDRFDTERLSVRLRLLGRGRQWGRCGHQAPDRRHRHRPHALALAVECVANTRKSTLPADKIDRRQ